MGGRSNDKHAHTPSLPPTAPRRALNSPPERPLRSFPPRERERFTSHVSRGNRRGEKGGSPKEEEEEEEERKREDLHFFIVFHSSSCWMRPTYIHIVLIVVVECATGGNIKKPHATLSPSVAESSDLWTRSHFSTI